MATTTAFMASIPARFQHMRSASGSGSSAPRCSPSPADSPMGGSRHPPMCHRTTCPRCSSALTPPRRPLAAIHRLYNVGGRITDGPSTGFLEGPVSQWVDTLTQLTLESGMDSYIFSSIDDLETQLRRFALEVAPQVRENVARHRV